MEKINAQLINGNISSNSAEAFSLYAKSRFGEKKGEKIIYSLLETFFLIEDKKLEIISKGKPLSKQDVLKKLSKLDKKFHTKYTVFKDLRKKGYIVKSALKFGAEFRVYEKGKKPENAHAKWIVFTEDSQKKLSWHDFSAKNRVAHSTKKKLLLAIVDEEGGIIYYEISWVKA